LPAGTSMIFAFAWRLPGMFDPSSRDHPVTREPH
jgi:hypothetical protein